jgi:hypothetical protein
MRNLCAVFCVAIFAFMGQGLFAEQSKNTNSQDSEVNSSNLRKVCEVANYGIDESWAKKSTVPISKTFQIILRIAKDQPEESAKWAPVLLDALSKVQSALARAEQESLRLGAPQLNLAVEGVSRPGISPDQIEDETIRRNYEAAIQANNKKAEAQIYSKALKSTFRQMLDQASRLFESGNNQPFLELINGMRSDLEKQ